MLLGFAPWIVYWVLVGTVPFTTAVVVALAIAVAAFVIGQSTGDESRKSWPSTYKVRQRRH